MVPEARPDAAARPDGACATGAAAPWSVYVLLGARGARTYVGISRDPERRLAQHNGERPGGARATRRGRPWRLAALHGPYASRSEAQRAERRLKRLRGQRRLSAAAARVLAEGGRGSPEASS